MGYWLLLLSLIVVGVVTAAIAWVRLFPYLFPPHRLQHDGHRFELRIVQARDSVYWMAFHSTCLSPTAWLLRRRSTLDRLFARSGLAHPAMVGDTAFARTWLLECGDESLAARFDPTLCRVIETCDRDLHARGCRLLGLAAKKDRLVLRVGSPSVFRSVNVAPSELLPPLASVVEALDRSTLNERATSSVRGRPDTRFIGVQALCVVLIAMAGAGYVGLARAYAGDPAPIAPMRLFIESLWLGAALFAVLALTWAVVFRRRREGARTLAWLAGLGIPAALFCGHALYREGNIFLDPGPARIASYTDARVGWTYVVDTKFTWLDLPEALPDSRGTRRMRLTYGELVRLGLPWPPINERIGVAIHVMPGAFGHPWVRCIERLPEPMHVRGIPSRLLTPRVVGTPCPEPVPQHSSPSQ